jgi:hypothetical protein
MDDMATAQDLLGLLAERDRLRVVAAVALDAHTLPEISTAAGLAPRDAARALTRLVAGGLLEGSAAKGYHLRLEALRAAARRPPEPAAAGGQGDVLGRFLRGGRLLAIPASRAKRLVVLDHLAGLFEPGRRYPEPEVNEALHAYHPDHAALRRHLVDEGFLDREDAPGEAGGPSVKVYWRTGGTVRLGDRP